MFNDTPVEVYTTSLSYRFHTTPGGEILCGNGKTGTGVFLKGFFSCFDELSWNRIWKQYVVVRKYRYYDNEQRLAYFPKYDLDRFLTFLTLNGLRYRIIPITPCPGKDIIVPMIDTFKPKDERQAKAIDHLINSKTSVRGLSLMAGGGKTATAIRTVSALGKRTMIFCSGLVEQWTEAILKFTKLSESEIYIIKGRESIDLLLKEIDKTIFPSFIVCSIKTASLWANRFNEYEHLPNFDRVCNLFNVGIRIVDEAHLNFYANYIADLRMNAAVTILLTATFDKTQPEIKIIFDNHYPKSIRHGEGDIDKYVDVKCYEYDIAYPGGLPSKFYKSDRGYSQIKLESWLLGKGKLYLDEIYETVYKVIIDTNYAEVRDTGEKLLVLCATGDMCRFVRDRIAEDYPDRSVAVYMSEHSDDVYKDNDIIVSTPGSAGTGRDIPMLRTCLVTISVRSAPLNIQMLGRLRKLLSGNTPIYAYTVCLSIPAQRKHAQVREEIYRNRALTFSTIHL